jgi:hypothetical protein
MASIVTISWVKNKEAVHLEVICLHYLLGSGKSSKKKKQRFKESAEGGRD